MFDWLTHMPLKVRITLLIIACISTGLNVAEAAAGQSSLKAIGTVAITIYWIQDTWKALP